MKYTLRYDLPHDDDNFLQSVLQARGIDDPATYLKPSVGCLLDPQGLDNIDKAAELLHVHLEKRSIIYLQIDSDVDGFTSAAYLWKYIKAIDPTIIIVPHIHETKRHGVRIEDIPDEADLVLIPDAGSSQYEEHAQIHEMGKDLIIYDHHEAERYSETAIVVNNQLSEKYENKSLCGVGVCYKFCEYYDNKYGYTYARNDIDLIATGLIADMMDLRPMETRFLTMVGLARIKNPFLVAALNKTEPLQKFSVKDVAFSVAPLVNAVIRVGSMEDKQLIFRALIEGELLLPSTKRGAEEGEIETIAQSAVRTATNAKQKQKRYVDKALEGIEIYISKYDLLENAILFIPLEDDTIPPNLTGLIATQLTVRYGRPALVVRLCDDGIYKGSARGLSLSDIPELKDELQSTNLFELAEGHQSAFGVQIKEENVPRFIRRFNKEFGHIDTFGEGNYQADYIWSAEENLYHAIMELGSQNFWGQGIETPLMVIEKIPLSRSDVSIIGKNSDTTKFSYNGITYIIFKSSEAAAALTEHESFTVDICGECSINEWNGYVTPQILIKDYNIYPQ